MRSGLGTEGGSLRQGSRGLLLSGLCLGAGRGRGLGGGSRLGAGLGLDRVESPLVRPPCPLSFFVLLRRVIQFVFPARLLLVAGIYPSVFVVLRACYLLICLPLAARLKYILFV